MLVREQAIGLAIRADEDVLGHQRREEFPVGAMVTRDRPELCRYRERLHGVVLVSPTADHGGYWKARRWPGTARVARIAS
jgi:hypothetical protein